MKVKIYTTPSCHWCKAAKEFFKNKKVKFEEVDASNKKWAEEMVKKSGQYSVPVIDIDGKIIIGFDEEEIENALKKT